MIAEFALAGHLFVQAVDNTDMNHSGGIYQIRQLSTGRKYIGSTRSFRDRRKDHFKRMRDGNHGNPRLVHAWLKYGGEDFVFEILEVLDFSGDELCLVRREQFYLDNVVVWGFDFNIATIADCPPSRKGKKFSDESLKRISEASKRSNQRRKESGYRQPPASQEVRKKMSDALIGRQVSPATREKIAVANTGKKHSDESKKKMSESALNRSDEKKAKIAASITRSRLGTTHSPELKEKISNSMKARWAIDKAAGKIRSEEHKRNLLEARRVRAIREREAGGVSAETRRKIGEKSRGRVQSEETKQKRKDTNERLARERRAALSAVTMGEA